MLPRAQPPAPPPPTKPNTPHTQTSRLAAPYLAGSPPPPPPPTNNNTSSSMALDENKRTDRAACVPRIDLLVVKTSPKVVICSVGWAGE